MADDVARLVAVLEANMKSFTKGMDSARALADRRFGEIEKRMRASEQRFSRFGSNFGSNFGRALVSGAAIVGVQRFVSTVAKAASEIQDTADAIGVSTDALQEWGALAGKAGVKQETFNNALDKFAKSLGEAQLKGGPMKKMLDGLGVGAGGTVEESFLNVADAIKETGNQQQRVAITTQLFGRGAAGLVPVLQQGKTAIKEQGDELKRTAGIMSTETIPKIAELEDKWEALKRRLTAVGGNVLAGFADEFSQFADELSSPRFQLAMTNFGRLLAEVAGAVATIAPFLPALTGAFVGSRLLAPFGPQAAAGGALIGGIGGAIAGSGGEQDALAALERQLKSMQELAKRETRGTVGRGVQLQIEQIKKKIAELGVPISTVVVAPKVGGGDAGGLDRSGLLAEDSKKSDGDSNADAHRAARTAAKTASDAAKAAADVVKAVTDANVELTRGTLAGFDAVRRQIDENAAAALLAIDEERKAKIAALNEEELAHQTYIDAVGNLNDEAASEASAVIIAQRNQRLQNAREEVESRHQLNAELDGLRREAIVSEHDAILELARGTEDYYAVARELSDERASLEVQRIQDELAHKLESMEKQKEEIEKAGEQWDEYEQERVRVTTEAELAIAAVRNQQSAESIRLHEQETLALENQIQMMDFVRDGLEDVAASGVHGFKSLAQAGQQFLAQLAEMAVRIYIIKPLLDALLGRPGTTGGGALNTLSSLISREHGGPVSAGRAYVVGEKRPELFVPHTSGNIIPSIPTLSQRVGQQIDLRTHVSLSGANGDETIMRYARQGALEGSAMAVAAIRKQFPRLMIKAQRDHF